MSRLACQRRVFILVLILLLGSQVAPTFSQSGVDGLGDIVADFFADL